MVLHRHKQGVALKVTLTPNAAHSAIRDVRTNAAGQAALYARVTAVPERGKANKALLKLLANDIGYPPSSLSILSGETDRHKTVLVSGDTERLWSDLTAWLGGRT